MKKIVSLIALELPLYAVPVHASPELAAKSKCMSCHQVDKKMLGPSFKDISIKYKDAKDADDMLTEGILKGVKGKWGKIPMPAQKISKDDAEALAKWILTL